MEKLQENTQKNEKETFSGTPKPTSMICYQKEGHELGVQCVKYTKHVIYLKYSYT